MSENTNENPNQALIDSPHGLQEGIKIKLLDMNLNSREYLN